MRESRSFPIACSTLGRTVELETRNWYVEIDGENEVIHYRAQCECGYEHFGSSTEFLNETSASEMRAYVPKSFEEMWQYPAGEQLFSELADGGYVRMTSQGINMWRGAMASSQAAHTTRKPVRGTTLFCNVSSV